MAKNVVAESSATDRLAQAFQTLVREDDQRQRLLALAKEDVAASPLGNTEGFETVWDHVAEKLLTSYSDETFVSEAYGRELSGARTQAIAVEQVSDDPPDRVGAWLSTVATSALRSLDLTLLLDLLRIEEDEERWGELMSPIVALLEDLLLVGDFDAAVQLIEVIAREAAPGGTKARRQHAMIAIDMLVAGPMMRHIVDAPRLDRRRAVRAGEGDVRVARRGAGAAARRGAVGRRPSAPAAASDRRSCCRSETSAGAPSSA